MRRLRFPFVALLVLAVVSLGTMTGCTRKRPVPTPISTATPLAAPTATSAPAPGGVTPQITSAAAEEGGVAQPTIAPSTVEAPSTPVPTVGQVETVDYTVGPGETLFSIAQRLGTDVDELRRLNNLSTDNIEAGQVIKVPSAALINAPTATPVPGQPVEHIVQRGEYLKLIAEKYGVSPDAIIKANNLRNPNFIYPGQKLIIPAPGVAPERPGGTTTSGRIHIVQRGETLQSIALRYGVTVSELAAANGIRNPNFIYVGQKLVIP